jgi:hypothetical protein
MSILVIDDQRIFNFPDAVHVTTSQEGIKLLDSQEWDEVWLDHDLGEDSEGSGSDIVRHIVATRPSVDFFVVHSMNTVAANYKAMRFFWSQNAIVQILDSDAMEKHGRNPFYQGPKRGDYDDQC